VEDAEIKHGLITFFMETILFRVPASRDYARESKKWYLFPGLHSYEVLVEVQGMSILWAEQESNLPWQTCQFFYRKSQLPFWHQLYILTAIFSLPYFPWDLPRVWNTRGWPRGSVYNTLRSCSFNYIGATAPNGFLSVLRQKEKNSFLVNLKKFTITLTLL
jgi:hypothetical protein